MIELKQEFLNRSSARIFSLLPFEKTRADVARDDKRTWTLLMLSLWLERRGAVRGAAADDTWQAVASTSVTPSDRGKRPG